MFTVRSLEIFPSNDKKLHDVTIQGKHGFLE